MTILAHICKSLDYSKLMILYVYSQIIIVTILLHQKMQRMKSLFLRADLQLHITTFVTLVY